MKLIIAGSRDITNLQTVLDALQDALCEWGLRLVDIEQIVSGKARGVDTLGEEVANMLGIPVAEFMPDWNKYGAGAGTRRNYEMASYCTPGVDCLLAVRLNKSPGTTNMINAAKKQKLRIFVRECVQQGIKPDYETRP